MTTWAIIASAVSLLCEIIKLMKIHRITL